jgi:hypothetical protein
MQITSDHFFTSVGLFAFRFLTERFEVGGAAMLVQQRRGGCAVIEDDTRRMLSLTVEGDLNAGLLSGTRGPGCGQDLKPGLAARACSQDLQAGLAATPRQIRPEATARETRQTDARSANHRPRMELR